MQPVLMLLEDTAFRLIFRSTNSCKTQNLTLITCQGNLTELTSCGVFWVNGWEIANFSWK